MVRHALNLRTIAAAFVLAVVCGVVANIVMHQLNVGDVGVAHNSTTIVQDVTLALLSYLLIRKCYRGYDVFAFGKVTAGRVATVVVLAVLVICIAMGIKAAATFVLAGIDAEWAYRFMGYHAYRYVLDLTVTGYACVVVAQFILAPLAEELFFRGVLLRYLSEKYNVIAAIIITSILFSAVHFDKRLYSHVSIFVFSIIVSVFFIRYRSIWLNALLHSANNVIGFYLEYVLNFHTSMDDHTFANVGQWIPEIALLAISVPALALYVWRSRAYLVRPWPTRDDVSQSEMGLVVRLRF